MGNCRDCYHAKECEYFDEYSGCGDDCFEDAQKIEKLKKNAEMYRWHDLRKNPEDLPRQDGLYSVAVEYDTDYVETGVGYYENMDGSSGWRRVFTSVRKVIAWRYIEPFEEE